MHNLIDIIFAGDECRVPRGLLLNIFRIALVGAILYAFYAGFRAPGLWTSNYWQPSFADGFFRRALIGTIFFPFGCERFNYFTIELAQFGVLLIDLCLFVYLGMKSRKYFVMCCFFVSAAGGYFFMKWVTQSNFYGFLPPERLQPFKPIKQG